MLDAIDLFAGPGGWDVAAARLGLDVLGIEFDHSACETRRAAGHGTIEGDVRNYGPADFPARGLIASPPCQTFSTAGKGAGRAALDIVETMARKLSRREAVEFSEFDDPRTALVLEPLRWALAAIDLGKPFRWLAFEQVPTVLPVWEIFAELLRAEGYAVDIGNLQAEQYGVPQTRKRAILIARFGRGVALPTPTHSRYYPTSPSRYDANVMPWVPMQQALGVSGVVYRGSSAANAAIRSHDRPAPTVLFGASSNDVRWYPAGHTRRGVPEIASTRSPLSRRVTVPEAGVLQTFSYEYPWRGTQSEQLLQVGNAIPPLLAEAVLASVVCGEVVATA